MCSVYLTATPLLLFLCALAAELNGGANDSRLNDFLGRATDVFLVLYIIARLCTFFLVVLSFWSLPPGIYDEISLSSFIPHF